MVFLKKKVSQSVYYNFNLTASVLGTLPRRCVTLSHGTFSAFAQTLINLPQLAISVSRFTLRVMCMAQNI